jgi:hypothetical protein
MNREADRVGTCFDEQWKDLLVHSMCNLDVCRAVVEQFVQLLANACSVELAKVLSLRLVDSDITVKFGDIAQ